MLARIQLHNHAVDKIDEVHAKPLPHHKKEDKRRRFIFESSSHLNTRRLENGRVIFNYHWAQADEFGGVASLKLHQQGYVVYACTTGNLKKSWFRFGQELNIRWNLSRFDRDFNNMIKSKIIYIYIIIYHNDDY